VRGRARLAPDPTEPSPVSRDSDDDYLVALAIAVSADALVTGDADLLDVPNPAVRIVALRPFLDSLPGFESV
jgi:predicted nucleic acid-binding protein